jgi:hypothetical protein
MGKLIQTGNLTQFLIAFFPKKFIGKFEILKIFRSFFQFFFCNNLFLELFGREVGVVGAVQFVGDLGPGDLFGVPPVRVLVVPGNVWIVGVVQLDQSEGQVRLHYCRNATGAHFLLLLLAVIVVIGSGGGLMTTFQFPNF